MFHDQTVEQRNRALRAITLVEQKRSGKLKGRTVADGRGQRDYLTKEEAASPTVSLEALFLSCAIDAYEERYVVTSDISGAFLQADMDDFVLVVFEGVIVDLLCQLRNDYKEHIFVTKSGRKLLYVQLNKAMYGTIKAAMLFWKHLSAHLTNEMGFKVNPYDPCVVNKTINGKQCTVCFYVDDLKISHKDPEVVEEVLKGLESKYGKMGTVRGKDHTYVGMRIIYNNDKSVTIDMKQYAKDAIDEFPELINKSGNTPATEHLFEVDENAQLLDKKEKEIFHRIVAKLLFLCKRARPDISVAIAFLTSRTTCSDVDDWKKLRRVLQYLYGTQDLTLTFSVSNISVIKWWVDASYAVHPNMRSHTGACMSLGRGMIYSKSVKQKLNSKSSTEAEVIAVSDLGSMIFWTKQFLQAQGYEIRDGSNNIVHQDNISASRLHTNGRLSSGQNTRHINIRYFFMKDRIEKDEVSVIYCPTAEMIADFFTNRFRGRSSFNSVI